MIFEELPEFKKDLKSLLKKYRTLNDDLSEVKKVFEVNLTRCLLLVSASTIWE